MIAEGGELLPFGKNEPFNLSCCSVNRFSLNRCEGYPVYPLQISGIGRVGADTSIDVGQNLLMCFASLILLFVLGLIRKNASQQKRAQALERMNEELDCQVAETSHKFNVVNERLSTMLDTMPSPVFFKDTRGVYQGCNRAFAETILGRNVDDIVGRTLTDLTRVIPGDLARIYHVKDQELYMNPGVQSYEAQVLCADGERREFLFNKTTIHNDRGEITGLVGVMVDISARKSAEREREKLIAELHVANEKLEILSTTDPLTGLSNRRHIAKKIKEEIRKAERYQSGFSVIMIDLDHFKTINDTYGHHVGDLALQSVARVLRENVRDIDLVGRYGGEEFLILLPSTDLESGYIIAERMRKNIESMAWADEVTVTISGGIAEYHGESDLELFRKADELLYKAKQGGRNRIEKIM
jgi:diguanylate cyclase (GGDEF)-like protein/PAS domain S-box-containing protein